MKKYNKKDWLACIDQAIANKASIEVKTSNKIKIEITMSISTGFIAYHLAEKYADWETGKAVWCSQAKLAAFFNMSRQTISKAFAILEELGFMTRDQSKEKPGGSNYYDLTIPVSSQYMGVSLEDMGVSSLDRGCTLGRHGVSREETQTLKLTTNITTNTTNKRTTKGEALGVYISHQFGTSPIARRAPKVPNFKTYK